MKEHISDSIEMNPLIEPKINKEEIEKTENVQIKKDRSYVKIEDLKFNIDELKLNIELFNAVLLKNKNKKEFLKEQGDNIIFDMTLQVDLEEIDKVIDGLNTLIKKSIEKIKELEVRLTVAKIGKEYEIENQIKQN